MADLSLTVDVSSLTQAQKRLKDFQNQMGKSNSVIGLSRAVGTLENQIQELVRAKEKGRISSQTYEKGLLELKRQYEQLGYSSQKATAAVRKYAQQLADQRAAEAAARAARSQADRLRELRMRYREGYAAQVQMRRALMELNEAYQRGVISQEEYLRMQQRIREGNQGNVRSMNAMGMATQQVGYQVGDFLVQVQSGTNVMVALGQQATQLVGILPLMADSFNVSAGRLIAISAGLGIVIPLVTALGAAFMRTADEGKSFSDFLSELESSISDYKSAVKDASAETTELNARFGKVSESMRPFLQDLQELQRIEALNRLDETFEKLEASSLAFFSTLTKGTSGQTKELADNLGVASDAYKEILASVYRVQQAENLEQRILKTRDLRDLLLETSGGIDNMTDDMRSFYRDVVQAVIPAGELGGEVEGAEGSTSRLADEANRAAQAFVNASNNVMGLQSALNSLSMPFLDAMEELDFEVASAGMSAADKLVATRVRNMEQQMRAASERVFGFDYGLTPEQREQLSEFESALRSNVGTLTGGGSSDGGGGGSSGGGGASGVGQDVFGFARQFMGEEDQAQVWYDQQLEKLQEFNEKELDILRRHGINKATIEEEYASRLRKVQEQERKSRLSAVSGALGDVSTLMQSENKRLFNIGKAASLAKAVVNGYEAASEAWATGMEVGGPPVAAAFTAASLLRTGALISSIQSASIGGGGSGGGSSGGGGGGRGASGGGASAAIATPQASSQAPQRVLIEGLDPSALYSGEMIQSIFDAIYDENEERGAVFMVAT